MRYLHEFTAQKLPGGVESMIAYSFFNQGMRLPKNRVQYDLDVLRNSTFSSGRDIPQQLQSNAEVTEGISSHLRSTLRRLPELPDLNQLDGYDQTQLDARQAEIDDLIQLYSNQVSADYKTCRLDKEKLIMLSHLSQQQSMEVLEVNLRLAQVMEANQTQLKTSVEDDLSALHCKQNGNSHPNHARQESRHHSQCSSRRFRQHNTIQC